LVEAIQESVEQVLDTTDIIDEETYQSSISPERMAWSVLLIAFGMFCILTFSTAVGIYSFLFESTVSISTTLRVARGTVGITGSDLIEAVEREQEDLTNQATSISTDSQSQATIQFWDKAESEDTPQSVIAAATLQRNTFVTFNRAVAPRFEWSNNPYDIQLSKLTGQLDILVTGVEDDAFIMRIETEQGVIINLNRNGRYSIMATDDEVSLLNLQGEAAVFFADDFTNNRLVPEGQEVTIRLGNRSIELKSAVDNILTNGSFSLQPMALDLEDAPALPPGWGCRANQDEIPRGESYIDEFDGRIGMRLKRLNNATSHGEVGCVQPFGVDGVDVSDYDSIKVISTFYLNYQSLSKCGIAGSECPLMLLLTYDDYLGITRRWYKGFYYDELLSDEYPTRCSSCTLDHQNINEKVWFTYESDNLYNLIDEERRPTRIRSIEFYASGHQFDTMVSNMMILVSPSSDESEIDSSSD
jgi:hypothetical protein